MELHFQGWPAEGNLHFAEPSTVFEAWTAEAVGPALEAAEAALGEVASLVRSEHWQLVQVVTRQAEN